MSVPVGGGAELVSGIGGVAHLACRTCAPHSESITLPGHTCGSDVADDDDCDGAGITGETASSGAAPFRVTRGVVVVFVVFDVVCDSATTSAGYGSRSVVIDALTCCRQRSVIVPAGSGALQR